MDESTTERKPYRIRLPLWASIVIAMVVVVAAAVALPAKRAR
jgi:hypothetical protein